MQQPRPRFPLHGRMGPGHYGGQHHMMTPYGGYGPMMGIQQQFTSGRPMIGQTMGRGQGKRNGGGLLSKILGGKKQGNQLAGQRGMQTSSRGLSNGTGGMGSILQSLSNPDSITGFINNTQQVLKTAQSIGPMIQQYGPIVKNLPMMWKLYKGFKDLPTEEKSEDDKTDNPIMEEQSVPVEMEEQSVPVEVEPKRKPKRKKNLKDEPVAARKQHNGPSTPKLYI